MNSARSFLSCARTATMAAGVVLLPPLSAIAEETGHFAIMGSFKPAEKAKAHALLRKLRGCALGAKLGNSSGIAGFKPGFLIVYAGPGDENQAGEWLFDAEACTGSAGYIKRGTLK